MAESDSNQESRQVEVVDSIRLPCGHLINYPSSLPIRTQCKIDGRRWHVWKKGVEICAREE